MPKKIAGFDVTKRTGVMLKFKVTKKRSANTALDDGSTTKAGTTKAKPSNEATEAVELKDSSHCCGVSVTSKDSDIGSFSTENDGQECAKSIRSDQSSICSSGFQDKKTDSFEDSTYMIESSQSSSSGIVSDDHHHENSSTSNHDDSVFFNQSSPGPHDIILPAAMHRMPDRIQSNTKGFERRGKARVPIRKFSQISSSNNEDSDQDYTSTMVDMSHDSSSGIESGDPPPRRDRTESTKLGSLDYQRFQQSPNLALRQNGVHSNPHRRDLSWSTCSDSDMRSVSVFSSSDTDNNARYRNVRSTHQPIICHPGRHTPIIHQQRVTKPTRPFKSAPLKSKKHVTFQAANGIDPLIPCGDANNQNKHYNDSNILYYEDEGELLNDQYYSKQSGQELDNTNYISRQAESQHHLRQSPVPNQRQSPIPMPHIQKHAIPAVSHSQQQSPITTSHVQRQSPIVMAQNQRQSPIVMLQNQRHSPRVMLQSQRQSPVIMQQSQRQSPVVMQQSQRQSPVVMQHSQRQSPVVMQQNQRQSPVVMLQNHRQSPMPETAHNQTRQTPLMGLSSSTARQIQPYHQYMSSVGDENSGYQGSEDDDVTTDTSSEHHVRVEVHDVSRFTPSPRTLTPVPNAGDKVIDQKKRSKLCYFDKLPDDVMVKIFSHLPSDRLCRSSRVCRRWYFLAYEPSLWTCIKINNEATNVDKALKALTRRLSYDTPTVCVMVEKINLNGCEQLTDKGLYTIAKRCPELRQLEISGCPNVSNIALFELVSRCVNLEHLNTAGCENITCISLTPQATVQAQTYGKQIDLRYIDMSDCIHLEDSGLQIIASYCSQLVYLYLRRCVKVTDIGVQYVANYCANLKELSICDCKKVTDFGLKELSKLGSNLRYLSAAKCCKITDTGVKAIAKHCHRLRYLNVRGCEGVSDESVEKLAQNCPRLRSLDIGKCDVTDDSLHVLAEHCTQLRKLSLKSCDAITDKGITSVAERCRQLQQLNIQECHLTVNAYRTVKALCKKCIIEHTNPGFY